MFVDFSVKEKYSLEAGSFSLNFSAVVRGNVIWAFLGLLLNSVGLRGLGRGGRVRKWDRLSFSCVSLRSLSFRGLTNEALQVLKMYYKA